MPAKEKVSLSQLKVGILSIVALACITLIVFLLTGNASWFKKQIELHMYTSDAAGLTPGAPVRINGIQAGTVRRVELSGETNPQRVIRVDFVVDQDMQKQIPVDSISSVASDNLLGSTKFLQINKGTRPDIIQAGATVKSADTRQFDALIQQGYNVLDAMQLILGKVQDIVAAVEVGKGTIGKLLVDETLYNSLQATVNQVQVLAATLNSKRGIGRIINDEAFYNQVQSILGRFDQITADLQAGKGTAGMLLKDPKIANDLDSSLDQINTILTKINNGQGSIGKLINDPKMANQLSEAVTKLNVTLDKVNSGQGTIGQLLVNPQLYESTNGTTRELHDLLRDFRANPKKFLTIKLKLF
ncbi:MAG: MCE family protein [Acidobacteriaceae bacterium]|nr:MCE family protein [Acidobacteriaceae bacterium]MBV9033879.1 MCE family protein [Acidobacteriaceae bacterium]MBV9937898.1 MCE family protein [Acidobacteriaceae bacterium]